MSIGLIDQLETYFSDLDEAQGTVSEDLVARRLGNVRELTVTPTSIPRRPRLWVAVAAAAVVLVVIGVLPLLLSGSEETPPAGDPPSTVTTVVEPSTTTEATPTTMPEESMVPDTGALTFESLDAASFVTEWQQVDLPNENYALWLLSDGTLVAYHKGWDTTESDIEGSTTQFFLEGSNEPITDPTEHLLFNSDGVTWTDGSTDPFDGLLTYAHLEMSGAAPFFYVSAGPWDANPDLAAVWSTWATNDGETWFEVLVDGESAPTYFTTYRQIGNTVLVRDEHSPGRLLTSVDGGRTFSTSDVDRAARHSPHFVHADTFRFLAWSDEDLVSEPAGLDFWVGNPVLWESRDGENWTRVGLVTGLDPRPDDRRLAALGPPKIEALPDGTLVMVATETRHATGSGEGALYVLESHDGGLTWLQTNPVPTTAEPDHDSLIAAPQVTGTFNGWVVISTDDVTLATNGNTWVRVEGPIEQSDNGGPNPVVVRGLMFDFPWFANPTS